MKHGDSSLLGSVVPPLGTRALKALRESGPETAESLLRSGLSASGCTPADLESAGRMLDRLGPDRQGISLRVGCYSQCSVHGVLPMLRALAWSQGFHLHVEEGGYDQVQQDLAAAASGLDAAILIPWNHRLLSESGTIQGEVAFWQQAWTRLDAVGCSRILQVGFDWSEPGPEGFHLGGLPGGRQAVIRDANHRLREVLPATAYFLDLEAASGMVGRSGFYDPRQYHWTKQPFSSQGAAHISRHLMAGLMALTRGPKKVLVVDLDNTLWGGVVGEEGPLGIEVGHSPAGEAFHAFQSHLKGLATRGILLAVASKNDLNAAQEPFLRNPQMRLRLEDFAAFEASWEPKDQALRHMAACLNLGLDSFVFFDDNPSEREWIRCACPEVAVVDVPRDPADFCRALGAGGWFETLPPTREDMVRAEGYRMERLRRDHASTFATPESYLASLDMVGSINAIESDTFSRVIQLLNKTNQFNLTTRRHSSSALKELLALQGAIGLTLRMKDRFGDLGLVGVVLAVPEGVPSRLRVDTLLLSCRVIARTAEHFFLNHLFDLALSRGFQTVVGEFSPTAKNGLVAGLWPGLGFSEIKDSTHEVRRFDRNLEVSPFTTFVRRESLNDD